jgi:hypothetical protein
VEGEPARLRNRPMLSAAGTEFARFLDSSDPALRQALQESRSVLVYPENSVLLLGPPRRFIPSPPRIMLCILSFVFFFKDFNHSQWKEQSPFPVRSELRLRRSTSVFHMLACAPSIRPSALRCKNYAVKLHSEEH